MSKHSLVGNQRAELAASKNLGQHDLNETIQVWLILRRQRKDELLIHLKKLEAGEDVPPLDRQTFARLYSASPEDFAKVRTVASEHALTVVSENAEARTVALSGTVAQLQEVFQGSPQRRKHAYDGQYRGRTGAVHIPDELGGIVTAVLGLDNRPQVRSL